jgi:hypothetical protein
MCSFSQSRYADTLANLSEIPRAHGITKEAIPIWTPLARRALPESPCNVIELLYTNITHTRAHTRTHIYVVFSFYFFSIWNRNNVYV